MEQQPVIKNKVRRRLACTYAILLVGLLLLSGCSGGLSGADASEACVATDRDTNQFKQCLYGLKQLVESDADVPTAVLCDATPRTEEEYHISYRLTEETWTKEATGGTAALIDLNDMLWRYAMADSTGAMEAYLLFGEFADGYVAESAFDNYIALEEKYPSKFANLRKERSSRWNEAYDEWKAIPSPPPGWKSAPENKYRELTDAEIDTLSFDGYSSRYSLEDLERWKVFSRSHRPYWSKLVCSRCGQRQLVVYSESPQKYWESLCGRGGYFFICTHCKSVNDFECTILN